MDSRFRRGVGQEAKGATNIIDGVIWKRHDRISVACVLRQDLQAPLLSKTTKVWVFVLAESNQVRALLWAS
jgi:hypothetical protein